MFCKNCGNQIDENSQFCPSCGTATGEAAAPAPQPAKSDMALGLSNALKAFFSSNVTKGIGASALSRTNEWIVFLAAYLLGFAVGVPIIFKSAIGSVDYIGEYASSIFKFGPLFATSLLVAVIARALTVLGLFVQLKLVHKADISFTAILNIVEYASLPITVACLLNIISGLIFVPAAIIIFITAIIMQVILLYIGMQKAVRLEKSPFYPFSAVSLICVALIAAIAFALYKSCISSAIADLAGNAISSAVSGLSGLSGLSDLF